MLCRVNILCLEMTEKMAEIHERIRSAVGRLNGYRKSNICTTVSSHILSGPMTLRELSGLQKYVNDVLNIEGMRISALGDDFVLSVMSSGAQADRVQAKSASWFAKTFRKRGRDDDTEEPNCKRQAMRNKSLLCGKVADAVKIAKRAADANQQEVNMKSWEAASKIASDLVNIRGTNGEAVCQGMDCSPKSLHSHTDRYRPNHLDPTLQARH